MALHELRGAADNVFVEVTERKLSLEVLVRVGKE